MRKGSERERGVGGGALGGMMGRHQGGDGRGEQEGCAIGPTFTTRTSINSGKKAAAALMMNDSTTMVSVIICSNAAAQQHGRYGQAPQASRVRYSPTMYPPQPHAGTDHTTAAGPQSCACTHSLPGQSGCAQQAMSLA